MVKKTRNADSGTAPQAEPVSERDEARGGLTGLLAEQEQATAAHEEAVVGFNLGQWVDGDCGVHLAEGMASVGGLVANSLVRVICDLAGVKIVVLSAAGDPAHSYTFAFDQPSRVATLFDGISPSFFFFRLRLYGDSVPNLSPNECVTSALRAAVQRALSLKDEFCEFFGEPGVCELVACLTSSQDRANIRSMLERTRRNISRPEGDIIPLLSDAELPPPPSDGRASKVERRIRASALPGAFEHIEADLVKLHDPVVARFQKVLDALHERGRACATFEDNQELTRRVLELADRFGIKFFFDTPDRERHEVRVQCVNSHGSAAGEFRVWTCNQKKARLSSGPTFPRLVAGRLGSDRGSN
jgi:hypothetical protein